MFNLTLRHNFHTDELEEMNVFLLNKGFLFSGELFREGHPAWIESNGRLRSRSTNRAVIFEYDSHIRRYVLP